MDDRWYEIANLDHPWITRRFEVLRSFGADLIAQAVAIAEVGCGHGLLQRQVEDFWSVDVTGFDLNEAALRQTASRRSPVCCYNVLSRSPEYKARFDLIFLFDILEHISDQDAFLRAIQFHLAPNGRVLLNVPAFQTLFSGYDRAVGHLRRYNIRSLSEVARASEMVVASWSYWGLPLMPLLILRKLWMLGRSGKSVISAGFDSGSPFADRWMLRLSRCEPIPQRLLGTSLMAVLQMRR
jgi:SAM-dependent methyltransferase